MLSRNERSVEVSRIKTEQEERKKFIKDKENHEVSGIEVKLPTIKLSSQSQRIKFKKIAHHL